MDRTDLGEEHPSTLRLMNNLGLTLRPQGDLSGARSLHERVLAVRLHVWGEEHPATLTSMNNLGPMLREQGDLDGCSRASGAGARSSPPRAR